MNIFKFIVKLFRNLFHKRMPQNTTQQTELKSTPLDKCENFIGPNNYKNTVDLSKNMLQGGATPAPDPLFSLFEFVGTKLLTGLGAAAWNTFYVDVINKGVTEMTQILQNLEEINKKLDEMMKLYVNSTYETYINKRSEYVSALVNAQTYYNQQLMNLKESDTEKINKVLTSWSKEPVGGNSAMVQWQNFIDFILDVKINTNTLYNIYDAYVYNTTPFEHLGYDYRERLRDMDFAAIVTNAILCILFIKQNPDIDDTTRELQLETISTKLKKYYDYYDAHKVVRKSDKIICQIERTHFEMSKYLTTKDYISHSWMKDGDNWESENQESAWCLAWGDEFGTNPGKNCGKQLYKAEINRIKKYYEGSGKSLWDIIFNDMGVVMPHVAWVSEDQMRIPLATWVGDNPHGLHCRDISFGEVIKKGTDNISEEKIGTAYTEHTGFLWLKLTFRRWDSLDNSKKWHFMQVTARDSDNWKD